MVLFLTKRSFHVSKPLTINLPMMALFPPSSKIFLPDKQIIKMQCNLKKIIKNVILQLCGTNCVQCILKNKPLEINKITSKIILSYSILLPYLPSRRVIQTMTPTCKTYQICFVLLCQLSAQPWKNKVCVTPKPEVSFT